MRISLNTTGTQKKGIIFFAVTLLLISGYLFSSDEVPRAAVGLRFSAFGVPNSLVDQFIYEHPSISGSSFAFEYRSFGKKGPLSSVSKVISLEYSHLSGAGPYREEEDNIQMIGEGEVSQVSLTYTILVSIAPHWTVHPYFGIGLGVGKVSLWSEGSYENELGNIIKDTYTKDMIIPVAHIPLGLMININNQMEIRLEGGFKNGFYFGGGAAYNF